MKVVKNIVKKKRRQTRRYRGGNKKNLAIILYGRINSYEYSIDYFNSLYKNPNFNCKIFCSLNLKKKTPYIEKLCELFDIGDEQINIEPTIVPKKFTDLNADACNTFTIPCYSIYSSHYHQNKAFKLIEAYSKNHNIKYDIVIVFRIDTHPSNDESKIFPIENNIEPNTVYIPRINNKNTSINETKNISDCYNNGISTFHTYGDFDTMKKYCNLINNITRIDPPEIVVLDYLKKNNINIKRFVHEITKNPQRGNSKYNTAS